MRRYEKKKKSNISWEPLYRGNREGAISRYMVQNRKSLGEILKSENGRKYCEKNETSAAQNGNLDTKLAKAVVISTLKVIEAVEAGSNIPFFETQVRLRKAKDQLVTQ